MTTQVLVPLNKATADNVVQSFIGWHDQSNDGLFTTRAAIACNSLKTQITSHYGNDICDIGAATSTATFYKAVYQGHSNTANRRLALFKPAPVWITGSSVQSVPTLCTIDGYLLKLPLYKIIEHKAITLINAEIVRYKTTHSMLLGSDDVAASATLYLNCYVQQAKVELVNSIEDLIKDADSKFVIALACVMHATVTQHMCDIDAGVKFRDKRGRQAAFDELHASLNTLLYATPYMASPKK